MASFEDWNRIDDDDDEELQDTSVCRVPCRVPHKSESDDEANQNNALVI